MDIVNTSDQKKNSMNPIRRSKKKKKDFFSMAEYLIWAVNQQFELEYYKKKSKRLSSGTVRNLIFIN